MYPRSEGGSGPMRPGAWHPPVEPSVAEQTIMRLVRRAKVFCWLRRHRHQLFDDAFQAELAALYTDAPTGQPPVPPAQLALATIIQAYCGCADDEAIERTVMDRRWQLVLDCLDMPTAPFAKGTLVAVRHRLIATDRDRRLIERTVELARTTGGFGARALRRRWTPARCGEPAGWRTRSTYWAMRCARPSLWWPGPKGAIPQRWPPRRGWSCWPGPASRPPWIWTGMTRPLVITHWPRCSTHWSRSRRWSPTRPVRRRQPACRWPGRYASRM
jgi:hypothetical protein